VSSPLPSGKPSGASLKSGDVIRLLLAVAIAAGGLTLALSSSADEPPLAPPKQSSGPAARPHAVLLILDEFTSDSLLGAGRGIDATRYPNFASLAGDSVWFRNAYASYDSTTKAVPLILDGLRPRPETSPERRDHPRSIFDMFKRGEYRIVASEEASALCPPSMCVGGQAHKPAIIPNLVRGRPERYRRWVRSIGAGRRPTFWMKHLLMPHGPYLYLPSGARARPRPRDLLPGMNTTPGFHDAFLTRHNEQRYLLQVGFVDRLIGRLVRRLKSEGIYDRTLIVVTADHGISWQAPVETRRSVGDSNVQELTPVPFFVKRPGQRRGKVNDAYVRTLDVASTIADVLSRRLGYRDDGRSAFAPATARRRRVTLPVRDFSSIVSISGRRWEARRRRVVQRRLRDFGSGELGSLFTGIGPNQALIGREAEELGRASAPGAPRVALVQRRLFANVRRESGVIPTQIAGDLRGGAPGTHRELAVAVNGRIEAVGRSFYLSGDPTEHFAFNVPEAALREGHNTVEVFEVVAGNRLQSLARS
jgi:Sulfatase